MNSMNVIDSVVFFGCACGEPGDENFDSARATAKAVAQTGRRVVNGGGPGIMLAATLGAKDGGGKTTAVYYRPELATTFEGKSAVNFADEKFEEANYILRTKRLLELGDTYIVFNGGTGTLSEFAMAWGLARLYFGHHKPLILYGEFWHHLIGAFRKHLIGRPEEYRVFTIVTSPDEVLAALEKYEVIIQANRHNHPVCHAKDTESECSFLLL